MTVADLIAHLKTLPQDLPVATYQADESYATLHVKDIKVCLGDHGRQWYDEDGVPAWVVSPVVLL